MPELNLSGKRVVITGGSRGIGEQLVRQTTTAGAEVGFTFNSNEEKAKKLAEETGAWYKQLALGDLESTGNLTGIIENLGLNYLILNAGIEFSGNLEKHTPEKIREVTDANLIGNLYLLRGAITGGSMTRGGQIAVVGSIAADGNHDQIAYSAAKAGLRGAIESLSRYDAQVQEQGLGVKLLEPAFVRTDMTARILKLLERRVIKAKGGDALVKQFQESGLVMTPEYAASEILALTTNPEITGVRTIPEGINLHNIRAEYF